MIDTIFALFIFLLLLVIVTCIWYRHNKYNVQQVGVNKKNNPKPSPKPNPKPKPKPKPNEFPSTTVISCNKNKLTSAYESIDSINPREF